MNKFSKILLGIFVSIFFLSGCSLGSMTTGGQAKINKTMIAAEVDDKTVKQQDSPDGFSAAAKQVIFAVYLDGKGEHQVKVEWKKENSQTPLKTETKKISAGNKDTFNLKKPTTGWLSGEYIIQVFMDNQKLGEKNFSVLAGDKKNLLYDKKQEKLNKDKGVKEIVPQSKSSLQAKPVTNNNKTDLKKPKSNPAQIAETKKAIVTPQTASNPTFINGQLCTALKDDNTCQSSTSWYYDTAKSFSASTQWQDLKAGDSVWAVWYWEGFSGSGEYLADSAINVENNSTGNLAFVLNNNKNLWYSGSYWLEIYLNGNYFTTIPFAVYNSNYQPTSIYDQPGYFNSYGEYILYDGSGYIDIWGNFWPWDKTWASDYAEEGYYDQYGKYILYDGTGFYDSYGYFWLWQEWYGDGSFDADGNYILADGSGYYDAEGNWWSNYEPDGFYDEYGNYVLNDGSGYYDPYGTFHSSFSNDPATTYGPGHFSDDGYWILDDGSCSYGPDGSFWPTYPDYVYEDGYFDYYGNYILNDGSGYYDINNNFFPGVPANDAVGEDGYYDSYGNYILNSGEGFFDFDNNFHDMSEYPAYSYAPTDYYPEDYDPGYFDDSYWYSEEAVG